MRPLHVAFLTAERWPTLYEDDRLAAEELVRRGVTVSPVVWTETDGAALERFDAVMELEVMEPELFFRFESRAPGRFVEALLARLGR
ncbi:MAG: hypothetical protein AB1938_23230 [Myxococcota bacterium]